MEKKKKIKLLMVLVPLLLVVSALSGCFAANVIQTKLWSHTNSDGTSVRLNGHLIWYETAANWNVYIVYDTEEHADWKNYEHRITNIIWGLDNHFYADIDGLDRLTEYHYRAVGEHKGQGATERQGIDRTFIPGGPRVIVGDPSFIGIDSAIIEGELQHLGGAASCEVYFKYGTDPENLNLETTHETMTSTGNFNFELTGLSSCQIYYYRAVAINDADTWVSSNLFNPFFAVRSFTPGLPIVETFTPNEVTETTANYRGTLISLGGTADCKVRFEYSDKNQYDLDQETDNITLDVLGEFNIVCEGLTPYTTYWVRAVADNGVCEHRGVIKSFTTLGGMVTEDKQDDETTEPGIHNFRTEIIERFINRVTAKNPVLEGIISKSPLFKRFLN